MTPTLLLGFIALCLWPNSGQEALSLRLESGLSLQKRFQLECESRLENMQVSAAGVDQATGIEMSLVLRQEILLEDTYGQVQAGQPVDLLRHFQRIATRSEVQLSAPVLGPQSLQVSGTSPLLGRRIRHVRSTPGAPWMISAELAPKLAELPFSTLEGLQPELDFAELLPPGSSVEGATWSVPVSIVNAILAPAGDLKLSMLADEASGLHLPPGSQAPPLGALEGQVSATWTSVERGADGALAHIDLVIQVSSTQDLSATMGELLKMGAGPGGIEMQSRVQSYELTWRFEGSGKVIWDLDFGRLKSLSISGRHTQTVDSSMQVLAAGIEQLIANHLELSGSTRAKITFSP